VKIRLKIYEKKKEFKWENFEEVIGLLFKAQIDVKIDCDYAGDKRKRQFDGYYEIDRGEFLEPIKVAIECKNYGSAVPVEKVEAFTTKLNTCKINKGIMVSYRGFQRSAILQAREASIELIEFRELKEDDLKDDEALQLNLNLTAYSPIFNITNMDRQIISPELTDEEKVELKNIALKLEKNKNDFLYNENGIYRGSFLEFLENVFHDNVANLKMDEENIIKVDLRNEKYYMRQEWKEKSLFFKIMGFTLIITYNKQKSEFIIGSKKVQDWLLLNNITLNKSRLIPKSVSDAIRNKYLK